MTGLLPTIRAASSIPEDVMGLTKRAVMARISGTNEAYLLGRMRAKQPFASSLSREIEECVTTVRILDRAGTLGPAVGMAQRLLCNQWRQITTEEQELFRPIRIALKRKEKSA